jgi:two-component system chemotaxis sensor kinase CheA
LKLLQEHNIKIGDGLVGQCAQDHQKVLLSDIPEDYYKIHSGLGAALPQNVLLLPIEFEGEVLAVLEFASFHKFNLFEQKLLERTTGTLGISIHSVAQQMQVKNLLDQSQTLTEELQVQSEELQLQHEELRSTNEQLEKQYRESEQKTREIEKASQFKSEFLANMSHELRTPLNSMLILAQTLAENKEGNLNQSQVEYASTIHSAGKDLLNLINDILDLSKVESGKMDIILNQVNIEDLIKGIESQFNPVAQQKGISFEMEISSNFPQNFISDKQHLLQILNNLLSNAFKFTDEGNVKLEFYLASEEAIQREGLEGNSLLAFSVTDTGMGIPEEMYKTIFEAFRQVDGTMSRKYGGTGLGLSICRELAQLLGGTIKLVSEVGKGSVFTLFVPMVESRLLENDFAIIDQIAPSLESPSEDPEISLNPVLLAGKTILIVDDDMRNVFALTSLLEAHNMNILFAENGQEALETLSAHEDDIDLVLMDIMMPDMDGYETMRAIRQDEEFNTLPIIALTAKVMKNDRHKCLEAGASDYIQKPVIAEQLLSLMRVWLYERGAKN